MTRRMYSTLTGLIIVAGLASLILWRAGSRADVLIINGAAIEVEQATTSVAREKGLSGRQMLAEGHGLLFVFDEDARHSIWMKDMHFAIDVLWLDAGGRVVYLVDDMDPSSYPTTYLSSHPARYVLELTDQAIEHLDIRQGVTTVGGL